MTDLVQVYDRMIDWMKELVIRVPKLKPLAEPLYKSSSYTLFIAVLSVNEDFEEATFAAKNNDDVTVSIEVDKAIDKLLLENDFTRSEFDPAGIAKIAQYMKLWVYVV